MQAFIAKQPNPPPKASSSASAVLTVVGVREPDFQLREIAA